MGGPREFFEGYYKEIQSSDRLTEREKMFIGLAVTLTKTCEPWTYNRLAGAREAGVSREDLDAVVNLVSAVNAGVCQAIANRGYKEKGLL